MKDLGLLFSEEASIALDRLEGFATPTLMIAGKQDLLFPSDALRLVADLIPGMHQQTRIADSVSQAVLIALGVAVIVGSHQLVH